MNGSSGLLAVPGQAGETASLEFVTVVLGPALEGSWGMATGEPSVLLGVWLGAIGLLGLAGHESSNAISELVERVERLASGECGVEFPTDRDDDIGRLSEALDELGEQLSERRQSATGQGGSEAQPGRNRQFTDGILDALDDIVYVLDREGDFLRWNQVLQEVTGYSEAEIDSMQALDLFPETERDRIAEAVGDVFETGETRVESELLTKDGDRVAYEFIATRLEDPDGNPVLTGIGRDITERKERERQLRKRERELTTLMDNIPGIVYRTGNEHDWPFEFVSEGCREVIGYEPDALERGEVNWAEDVIVDESQELWETVQAAIESREPYRTTYRIKTADGNRRWIWEQGRGVFDDEGDLEWLEGVMLDITDQKEYERELERTTDFLEETQQIARVGGWELDLSTGPPHDGDFTDELYRIHELPVGTEMDMEEGIEYYHPDDRDRVREAVERAIETGERYELEARFITARNNHRWVRTTGIPVYEDGEIVKLRGALQDITETKEHERALESLQETTRGLLGTETTHEVAQLVVERAQEFLDVPGIAIYLLDDETNQLEPLAFSSAFVDLCDQPEPVSIDRSDSVLWDAFVGDERTVVDTDDADDSAVFTPAVERGLAVPVGDYGVFVFASATPTIDEKAHRLVGTLAATTEAALDRLESEHLLRERESELEVRNRRLRQQIQINNIIRSVHTSLIGSDSQAEIERTVCECLVEAEHVELAWIGAVDPDGNEIALRAWEGTGQEYLDELSRGLEDGTEPAVVTARSGEPTVVSNVVEGLTTEDWRQRALLRDFHSVVSVPLSFDEFSAGVLTVYASEPDTFGELERNVFTELGGSIANSILAVNTQQALHAEKLVELRIRLGSDSFFTRITREAGCGIEYEGVASAGEDQSRLFFTTSGADPDTVLGVLDELVSVTEAVLVSESGDECLFEVIVTGETMPARIARYGARLGSLQGTGDEIEIVVDVPKTTEVREFLRMLDGEYSDVELLARRDVERSLQTRQRVLEYLLDRLTDRQLEVLRTAYYAGFFEWPRSSTGQEIAEMLDVSQPTVNRHLRLSQQRLLEGLFEESATEGG